MSLQTVPPPGPETGPQIASRASLARPPGAPSVEVFGVRHHGPGSARSLVAALDAYQPDQILVEGPADADPLLPWVGEDDLVPPVALMAYAVDQPGVAAFWPFAVFSPEWQALRWAVQHAVPAGFCDLPAATVLAGRSGSQAELVVLGEEEDGEDGEAADDGLAEYDGRWDRPARAERERRRLIRRDPLRALAEAGGYDDPERWWEDVIESRYDGPSPFPLLIEAMTELRADVGPPRGTEARREAFMRSQIRAALRSGAQRVAVVCGAWHAPVLTWPLPPASRDIAVLRGTRKRRATITWVPWTHDRLALASGYGAGITSPGWYHHLWTVPDQPIARWMTAVAQSLRSRDRPVSSAHVIEAVRLAEALAAVRNRPLAGLAEVTDAVRAVLCEGDELAVQYLNTDLVVGQALGQVSPDVPTVPLEADLTALCRSLRLKREATKTTHDLDLRRSIDRQRSTLFHRLQLLGVDWAQPAESQVVARGTFRESWQTRWRPEHALRVVEASVWGTTVAGAAAACAGRTARDGTLLEIVAVVSRCLLADLPDALSTLLTALAERAALDTDLAHLMAAVPELVRASRYGSVRGVDQTAIGTVTEAMLTRICAGLARALNGLGDDAAAQMRGHLDEIHLAVALLEPGHAALWRDRWLDALQRVLDDPALPGLLSGRITRMLLDAERLDDAHRRVERALSYGVPAPAKASWIEGFFADGALLLIHDPVLRGLVDSWVSGLTAEEFVAVLPLVRRTFATFSTGERRVIAERILAPQRVSEPADVAVDLDLVGPALATVDLILGPP
jgi:Family of unknown function (DUF5682)